MVFDYFSYWQDRIYYNQVIEDYQRELLTKYLQPGSVLDIGCGTGRLSPLFDDYLGVDVSEKAIIHAKRLHPKKEFRVLDLLFDELPEANNIVSTAVLQHVPYQHIEVVARKVQKASKNLMLFELKVDGFLSPWCYNHDYEQLFGEPLHKEQILDTPTNFMVFAT